MLLPPELNAAIGRLRAQVQRYVVLQSLGWIAVVVGVFFWVSYLCDWIYFAVSQLELPQTVRLGMLASAGLAVLACVVWGLLLRLGKRLDNRSLALVLERKFPSLDDRLVASVEAAESPTAVVSPISQRLLDQTLAEATLALRSISIPSVFDWSPLVKAVACGVLGIVSISAVAAMKPDELQRWWSGFVRLDQTYWPRKTQLITRVVVPPRNELRPFTDGVYRHPRGADLTLQVDVDSPLVPVSRVRIDYRQLVGKTAGRVYLANSSAASASAASGTAPVGFRHTFPSPLGDLNLWVRGGDFATPVPLHVMLVDPPGISEVNLDCRFPEYTGLNSDPTGQTTVPVAGTKVAIPIGTQFVFRAKANKPIAKWRLEGNLGTDRWELRLDQSAADTKATLALRKATGELVHELTLPPAIVASTLSADGLVLALSAEMPWDGETVLRSRISEVAANPEAAATLSPFPIPPDSLVRIAIEDRDEIASQENLRILLAGIRDEPPAIDVALKGIGTSISKSARIPVTGVLTDDYGLSTARFEYQRQNDPEWKPSPLTQGPAPGGKDLVLSRGEGTKSDRFDVSPLNLEVQQKLVLSVVAIDGNTTAGQGPGLTRSQRFVLSIVSNEELLSLLYAREIGLRTRFEQIVSELTQSKKDVETYLAKEASKTAPEAKPPEQVPGRALDQLQALSAVADRSLGTVRKNASETDAIAEAFAEIREELVNNRVETPQSLERLERKIIAPLALLNEQNFPRTDGEIGLWKLAIDRGVDPRSTMEGVRRELDELINGLKQILAEISKPEDFNKAVELLREIITEERKLQEKIKRKRKANALKALE